MFEINLTEPQTDKLSIWSDGKILMNQKSAFLKSDFLFPKLYLKLSSSQKPSLVVTTITPPLPDSDHILS